MSAPMQFDRPAPPGDQFRPEDHVGALLVIEVLEHVPPQVTKASEKPQDSIRANVYKIVPPGQVGEEFQNTLLWPRVIVSRLRQSVGRTVLGVLTGQPGVKRDGRNVPYDLDDPQPGMDQAAVAAMTAHRMQAPAQEQAPAGWGQQPATQAPPQQSPWGQPAPVQQQAPAASPWGQQPALQEQQAYPQQQLPPAQQPQWGQQPPPAAVQPGWGQQPQQPPAAAAPAQQELPPWERDQPAAPPAQAPWGQQ